MIAEQPVIQPGTGVAAPPQSSGGAVDRGCTLRSSLLAYTSDDPLQNRVRERLLELLSNLGLSPEALVISYQLADAIDEQWGRFRKMARRCRQDFEEEAVHNARVHCRRLIARVSLAAEAMSTSAYEPVLHSLKEFLKPLGALRDVQVQKQALTDELARFPGVAGLWIELGKRELGLARAAGEEVARWDSEAVRKRLRLFQGELTDPAARLAAKIALKDSVVRALEAAYCKVRERRQAADPNVPASVHRVRIAYKRFRYIVESLPPAVGRPSALQLSAMREYQTLLGEVQDAEVLMGFLSEYTDQNPLVAPSLASFREAVLDRRRRLVDTFLAKADLFESFWPLDTSPPKPERLD
jgi:CHAD domain-containing protein